jgi:hypothetical protein
MFYIYRLTDGEQDYYGQTENPTKRLRVHKSNCKSRSKLLDKSKLKIFIIHTLYTQQEADETEEFYQLNFECVNKKITGRTDQEYYQANKEKFKSKSLDYYQNHKESHYNYTKKAQKKSIETKRYPCEICGFYFPSNNHLQKHLETPRHKKKLAAEDQAEQP